MSAADSFSNLAGPLGLYVHVPFCEAKCCYCDFASWVDIHSQESRWIDAMEHELRIRREEMGELRLDTIFIGGGTPSALSLPTLERLARAVAELPRSPTCEWSCEANPGSLTGEKLHVLREHGVNRMSIGVQSFDDDLLRRMGRVHDATTTRDACLLLEASGLRWNADLIFAVPGQTLDRFLDGLRLLVNLGARHVSFYGLTIEPGTEFARAVREGAMRETDEDEYARMYLEGVEYLEAEGIRRYEVSNFACPGEECRHNQGYWRRDSAWLAAGNAAHGYRPGRRWSSPRGLASWMDWAEAGCPADGLLHEDVSEEERYTESWFLGLRRREGVDLSRLREEFPGRLCEERMGRWIASGSMVREGDTVRLAGEGWLLLDAIVSDCSL
jgi:oxygen-independent coproporphyrinogen-3 oxidase